jgi:hypothetical protein
VPVALRNRIYEFAPPPEEWPVRYLPLGIEKKTTYGIPETQRILGWDSDDRVRTYVKHLKKPDAYPVLSEQGKKTMWRTSHDWLEEFSQVRLEEDPDTQMFLREQELARKNRRLRNGDE